jgi:predicted amidohydrolase
VTIAAPSFPVLADGQVFNRCFVFGPQGRMGYQDKYFMTRFETEDWDVRRAPARLCVFEADWGCFGIQICYDLGNAAASWRWWWHAGATHQMDRVA